MEQIYKKRGKIISFMNMKGGVGKTSLCVNMAIKLTRKYNKKILIVDLDPQMNATQYLLTIKSYTEKCYDLKKTIYELFEKYNTKDIDYSIISGKKGNNNEEDNEKELVVNIEKDLSLLAGNYEINHLAVTTISNISSVLINYFNKIKVTEQYDYIFIDCPPTSSIYTNTALLATSYYILVFKPDYFSNLGFYMMTNMIKEHNKLNPHKEVKLAGIVCNMFQKNQDEKILNELKSKYGQDFFSTIIPLKKMKSLNGFTPAFFLDTYGLKKHIEELSKEFLLKMEEIK